MEVYLLWHTHDLTDDFGTHKEIKLIGVFSSEEKAKKVIDDLKDKEGFRDHPLECFEIGKNKIDSPSWTDGFFIARWTE